MRLGSVVLLAIIGLVLIWLPTLALNSGEARGNLTASSALASVGLLLLLGILHRAKKRR